MSLYEVIIVMTCMGYHCDFPPCVCVCNCDEFVALVTADLWSYVAMTYRCLCGWNIAAFVTGILPYM